MIAKIHKYCNLWRIPKYSRGAHWWRDRVVGNVDDQIRHAVTKLSHIHFVTNEESEKVLKLGEQSFRIFNVGNPGLDRFVNVPSMPLEEISKI